MKLLVIHRQQEVIDKVKSVLSNHESIIRFSNSGLDGLLAGRIENYDLIICGTDLPVLTGLELIRSLRTNSINSTTPVIFLQDAQEMESQKVMHLAKSLKVYDILSSDKIEEQLAAMVYEQKRVVA